jgi:hypothetical protein
MVWFRASAISSLPLRGQRRPDFCLANNIKTKTPDFPGQCASERCLSQNHTFLKTETHTSGPIIANLNLNAVLNYIAGLVFWLIRDLLTRELAISNVQT